MLLMVAAVAMMMVTDFSAGQEEIAQPAYSTDFPPSYYLWPDDTIGCQSCSCWEKCMSDMGR